MRKDVNEDFEFGGLISGDTKETWDDLSRFVKRKSTSSVQEKIKSAREKMKKVRIVIHSLKLTGKKTGALWWVIFKKNDKFFQTSVPDLQKSVSPTLVNQF